MVSQDSLIEVFARISDFEEMKAFFEEILTPKEIQDLALRWKLLQELDKGKTQRSIASQYGISLCKITRGSKILKKDQSVTKKYLREGYAAREPGLPAAPDET
ncbi:MAG: transcriptional regulator [Deltaproteobacteria bacterium]|nr:transcriptional regulator [Deltaproteobacteria bacterium]